MRRNLKSPDFSFGALHPGSLGLFIFLNSSQHLVMSKLRGVPALSYVRVVSDSSNLSTIEIDGNSLSLFSDSSPRSHFDGNYNLLPLQLNDGPSF